MVSIAVYVKLGGQFLCPIYFSILLEKIAHRQILKYLLGNSMISWSHFFLLPGKSTHEAIFKMVHNVYSAMNNNKILEIFLLDIAKAVNCIDHNILYSKMDGVGFGPLVIDWFKSYLNRTHQVIIQGALSEIIPVCRGIAQGTVLGPILFIFYINHIFKCTNFAKMTLFADDCVWYLSGNNSDFNAIIDWNNLRLNRHKTKGPYLLDD